MSYLSISPRPPSESGIRYSWPKFRLCGSSLPSLSTLISSFFFWPLYSCCWPRNILFLPLFSRCSSGISPFFLGFCRGFAPHLPPPSDLPPSLVVIIFPLLFTPILRTIPNAEFPVFIVSMTLFILIFLSQKHFSSYLFYLSQLS